MKEILLYIYAIGQVIEIIGAYLLWRNAVPPALKNTITNQSYFGPGLTHEQWQEKKDEFDKYKRNSGLGFLFILLGVLLQFLLAIFNIIEYIPCPHS